MKTITLNTLNEESAETESMTLEEAAHIVGGATAALKPAQEPYLKYKLENVLISSYS